MKSPFRILATTDFQPSAQHAADRAFRLAAETGAQLTLMHTIRQRVIDELHKLLGRDSAKLEEDIHQQAHDSLAKLAAELGHAHGIAADIHLATGKLLQSILDHAAAIDAGLLVFGTSGGNFLLGTTAARLIRMTRLPILVVKQAPSHAYQRVLVPVDFSPVSARSLQMARQLAPQAHIVLLHAFESAFEGKLLYAGVGDAVIQQFRSTAKHEAQQQLHVLADTVGGPSKVSMLALHGNPAQRIIEQEQVHGSDLIVMGKQGKDMIEEFLLGSVTKHVLAESQCDVLVMADGRPPREADNDV
ncbi:MAG: universal stress protein [Gammaproteobacteria bacterium]|nr:universal stress protein [Rhodocyclaceae bacterium]MBU3909081.1 universal stress protein [Gammaproteobacteria bacterium]MBU4003292.1 universal stress protein [Gammaproteobacteria bacterium]MBU4022124.1 universal stress protein [Gammaproteobacteria bacterium]MBU4147685.1 universal stress protein [Gammaproteobacteria bacterium]